MHIDDPLHVAVARALGWSHFFAPNREYPEEVVAYPPATVTPRKKQPVPKFHKDWSAIGPLIQAFEIQLSPTPRVARDQPPWWTALSTQYLHIHPTNDYDPRVAASQLILALHKEGKLLPYPPPL